MNDSGVGKAGSMALLCIWPSGSCVSVILTPRGPQNESSRAFCLQLLADLLSWPFPLAMPGWHPFSVCKSTSAGAAGASILS